MPQTVSQQIYAKFFENLASQEAVRPETIAALKALHARNHLSNGRDIAKLVQEIEERHAHDQNADG